MRQVEPSLASRSEPQYIAHGSVPSPMEFYCVHTIRRRCAVSPVWSSVIIVTGRADIDNCGSEGEEARDTDSALLMCGGSRELVPSKDRRGCRTHRLCSVMWWTDAQLTSNIAFA